MSKALEGVRILDMGHVQAAPTAVGQLASVRIAGNLTNLAINGGFESGPLGTQTSGWQTDAGVTLAGASGPSSLVGGVTPASWRTNSVNSGPWVRVPFS